MNKEEDEGPKPKGYTGREKDQIKKKNWIEDRPDWITGFGMDEKQER